MIESLKRKIWEQLQRKEVSLAMIYGRDGRILWHQGRPITGRTVADGEGFPKSLIERTTGGDLEQDDVMVTTADGDLSRSARMLRIKSLLILPAGRQLFLYLDSGVREAFSAQDREVFRVMGQLLAETVERFLSSDGLSGGLSGSSPAIQAVRERVVSYAVEREPVLLTGETGTGKSYVAGLIHAISGRGGPLVTVHVPSIPETLFEGELFGHRKGSFSGAAEGRKGLAEAAEGGTLFLDEIAEVPQSFQAKLLQLVDTKRFRTVGDTAEKTLAAQIIAATNRDLGAEIAAGRFRKDLYYRLNVLPVELPPLRQRRDDIRDIAQENLILLRGKDLSPGAWDLLLEHDWPGNVRELLHVMTRAGIDCPGPVIGREIERLWADRAAAGRPAKPAGQRDRDIDAGRSFWDTVWQRFLDREMNKRELQAFLCDRFQGCNGSLKELASRLNIAEDEYPRFVSMLHKYDIHPNR